jgi:hypothetical protein
MIVGVIPHSLAGRVGNPEQVKATFSVEILESSECMDTCGIAGEYHHLASKIIAKSLHPFPCQAIYIFALSCPIWAVLIVTVEVSYKIYATICLKAFEDMFCSRSRVKKSNLYHKIPF